MVAVKVNEMMSRSKLKSIETHDNKVASCLTPYHNEYVVAYVDVDNENEIAFIFITYRDNKPVYNETDYVVTKDWNDLSKYLNEKRYVFDKFFFRDYIS